LDPDAEAVLRLCLAEGGVVAAGLLAVAGALWVRPLPAIAGAAVMLAESLTVMAGFALMAALASGCLLLAAREMGPVRGTAKAALRLIGCAAAVAALFGTMATAQAGLAFVAVAGWWPVER
jgi:hypothetical protein